MDLNKFYESEELKMDVSYFTIFIPVIAAISSGIIAYMAMRNNIKNQFKTKRYIEVVFPAFRAIEKEMFIPPSEKVLAEIQKIFENNPELVGVECLYWLEKAINEKDETAFYLLCNRLSYDYDELCSFHGIPKRSFKYCIERHQYKDVKRKIRAEKIKKILINILLFGIVGTYLFLITFDLILKLSRI